MKLACLLVAGAGAFPASGRDNLAPLEEAAAAEAEAYCDVIAAADTADLLKASYESLEDAYDADAHGHATYDCAAALVDAHAQYDKAEPYLWCVVAHCEDCDGSRAACPTASVGLYERDECESAVFNYLGFVSRKKDEPDFERAEEYYLKALELWPENCGALEYLAELYATTGAAANVTLCEDAEASGARAAAPSVLLPAATLLMLRPRACWRAAAM